MSGTSSDTEVNVSISGVATEFEQSCKAAASAMQGLKSSIDGFTTSMASAQTGLDKATPAMDAMRTASAASTQALTGTGTAATAASRSMQDLINQTTGVSRSMGSAGDSADVFRRALGDSSNEVKQLRSFFEEGNEGAGHFAHGTAGVTRELIVMAHEAVQGNFSRIPGSLMVLGERMGGITLATMGWAAAVAVAVYTVYELVAGWQHVEEAVRGAQAAQITVGTWSEQSEGQIRKSIQSMMERWGITKAEAADTTQLYAGMGGAAAQYSERIADAGHALAQLKGGDQVEAANEISKAFNGGAQAALSWAKANHFVEGSTVTLIQAMIDANQTGKAMSTILDALNERFGEAGRAAAKMGQEAKEAMQMVMALGPDAPAGMIPDAPGKQEQQKKAGEAGGKAQSQDEVDQTAIIEKNTAALRDKAAMQDELDRLQASELPVTAASLEAIAQLQHKLATAHTQIQMDEHEATMAGYQAELIVAKDNAAQLLVIKQKMFLETAKYEGANAAAVRASANQVLSAQQAASDQQLRMRMAQIGNEEAASRGSKADLLAISDEKLAVLREYGKQGTIEYQTELNRRTALEKQAGDETIQLRLSKLRGDMEAARGNLTAQMAIQDQIVEMVKEHYGAETTQLQTELNKQGQLRAEAKQQAASLAVQQLEEKRRTLEEEMRAEMQHVEASRQDGEITIAQARTQQLQLIQDYRSAAAQILAIEAQKSAGIRAMAEQVARRQQELAQQSATAIMRANDRAAEETHRAWATTNREIADSFASEATSVLSGQKAMVQVLQGLGQHMVQSAIGWAGRKALAWAEGEIAQTAATDAQAALRAGADGASMAPTLAMLLTKWLGLETAKTAGSAAGDALRTGADTTAASASATTASTAALFQIKAAAAVAAANTYAAISAIPYIGPEMAPEAAAGADAAVMAFAAPVALAVGAWNLPGDAMYQLHKGETVVPQTFADGMRNAIGGGGGSGGGDTHN